MIYEVVILIVTQRHLLTYTHNYYNYRKRDDATRATCAVTKLAAASQTFHFALPIIIQYYGTYDLPNIYSVNYSFNTHN